MKLLSAIWCFKAMPLVRTRLIARGLICSALNRFPLSRVATSVFPRLALRQVFDSGIRITLPVLACSHPAHPFGLVGKVGLDNCIPPHEGSAPNLRCDVQLLPWITESSVLMEAI